MSYEAKSGDKLDEFRENAREFICRVERIRAVILTDTIPKTAEYLNQTVVYGTRALELGQNIGDVPEIGTLENLLCNVQQLAGIFSNKARQLTN